MKLNKLFLCSLSLSTLLVAENIDTRFNYFGNISGSKLSEKGYTLNNYSHDNVDNDLSLTPYTKLGAQLSLFYQDYTLTAQALTRKNHEKYTGELTWFDIKYDFNNSTSLKVGRIQATMLLNSDSIDIDYIHLWAKAPDEVYRISGINTFDGIELRYKNLYKDYDYNIVFTPYAKSKKNINTTENTESEAILDNVSILRLNIEKDALIIQGSYARGDIHMPNDGKDLYTLQNALEAYGNDGSRFSFEHKKLTVWTIGLKYEYDDFIFHSEYAKMDTTSLLANTSAYFMLFGYRYNNFTPFYIYARSKADKDHFDTSDIVGTTALINSANNVLYSTNSSQITSSIGIRYDYKPGIALTAQIDRVKTSNYGTQGNLNRRGILEYELGKDNEPIYMYIMGLSFAF